MKDKNVKIILILGILLSFMIIIITIIYIVQNQQEQTGAVIPEEYGISVSNKTFNSNFTPYEGENQSDKQIKALISTVKASNMKYEDHQVKLIEPKKLSSSKKYRVALEYGEDDYVNKIIITEE